MIRSKIRHLPTLVTLYTWAATVGREVVLEKKNSPSVLNKTGGRGGGAHWHITTAYAHAKNNTHFNIYNIMYRQRFAVPCYSHSII